MWDCLWMLRCSDSSSTPLLLWMLTASTAIKKNYKIQKYDTMCMCIKVRDRLWMLNGAYCDQLRIYDLKQLVINPQQEFVGKKILNSSLYSDFT